MREHKAQKLRNAHKSTKPKQIQKYICKFMGHLIKLTKYNLLEVIKYNSTLLYIYFDFDCASNTTNKISHK